MPDRSVYMIANLKIDDLVRYREYEKGFFPILKKHGGEFILFDDRPVTLEGVDSLEGRIVMFKFPSERNARAWYDDPDYQALCEHRRASTSMRFLTMARSGDSR